MSGFACFPSSGSDRRPDALFQPASSGGLDALVNKRQQLLQLTQMIAKETEKIAEEMQGLDVEFKRREAMFREDIEMYERSYREKRENLALEEAKLRARQDSHRTHVLWLCDACRKTGQQVPWDVPRIPEFQNSIIKKCFLSIVLHILYKF